MNILQAIFLGITQGLTEFFPVSSSGHLILLPRLFGWEDHSLAFDAVLHLGTGLAVLVYFRRDWWEMVRSVAAVVRRSEITDYGLRITSYVLFASVPAGLIGLLFNDFVETNLRSPQVVAVALFVVAVLMLLAEGVRPGQLLPRYSEAKGRRIFITKGSFSRQCRDQDDSAGVRISLVDALVIGFSQVLALIPGVSRSGITITAGLFRGLTRESAARFSFLLATPIVLAAGLWGLVSAPLAYPNVSAFGGLPVTSYQLPVTGFFFSFLFGFLAIKLFLKLLDRWGLVPFAVYRILLSLMIFIFF